MRAKILGGYLCERPQKKQSSLYSSENNMVR